MNGMRITGNAEPSGVFPPEFKPAQLEEADLWRVAKFAQAEVQERVPKHVLGKQVRVGGEERDMAEMVWDATLKEVRKGWLEGPFSAEEVTQKLGPLWTPSRRFGILQGGKVRNIDDLSEFSVNQAYGTPEKLDLGGVDEVVALSAAWIRTLQGSGRSALLGRCLDLKGAYKQIALHRADRPNAVLAVLDPSKGAVSFFLTNVLPFGATGAVMAFNRLSRALRDLLQKLLLLPVVNYFDDFPHVDVAEGALRSQVVMEEFLSILGWEIAREPEKRLPASSSFTVLGVVVDLCEAGAGVVKVSNKPGRAVEMEEVLEEVKRTGELSPAMAAKVQGRMMFAEAQCCGRWLVPVLEPVKARALMPSSVKWADDAIVHSLSLCERLLREAPCRRIRALKVEDPCVVFTDGAYEDGIATVGAVVISPRAPQAHVISFQVPTELTNHWKRDGHEQVIAQAELLPVLLVKKQVKWAIQDARVLYFIDNEGVKEALISGTTRSQSSRDMLVECMIEDSQNNSLPWYARIPSPSNLADAPSRLSLSEVEDLFDVVKIEPVLDYKQWGKIG